MIKKLNLGVFSYKGKLTNHRSLLKVILNPLLRFVGFYIGTITNNNKIVGLGLRRCKRHKKINYTSPTDINEYDDVKRIRILF